MIVIVCGALLYDKCTADRHIQNGDSEQIVHWEWAAIGRN